MKTIELAGRLLAIAEYVKQGASVIDVGTDHGYIPAFLVVNGIAKHVIASDVKKGPLERAVRTAENYGVAGMIEFMLADGLDGVDGNRLDTVIIAGMGGETIISILQRAPWTRENKTALILQPQTKLRELSLWLDNNGYAILNEKLSLDGNRIYPVIHAEAGERRGPFSEAELFADRRLMENKDPLLPRYLDMLIAKMRRAANGIRMSENNIAALLEKTSVLDGLEQMRKETVNWQQK